MRSISCLARFLLCLACSLPAVAGDAYPRAYARLVEAARAEQTLTIYSTTDAQAVGPLLAGFRQRYPFLRVDYRDLNSAELYRQLRGEVDAGHGVADIAWSSAMDLQAKLVNDGYAQRYQSPERDALPDWARWRDETYGTTFEPVVFAWDRRAMSDRQAPHTHAELRRQLAAHRGEWTLTGYNIEGSAVGYLLLTQDARYNPEFWDLAQALGPALRLREEQSRTMALQLGHGSAQFGYNLLGPYTAELARSNPRIGWRVPEDYALVVSRLTLISRLAPHPNAARLWTDYLLSAEGQQKLADATGLPPIRTGLPRRLNGVPLDARSGQWRPIQVGSGLLVYLDSAKQGLFLRRWRDLSFNPPH